MNKPEVSLPFGFEHVYNYQNVSSSHYYTSRIYRLKHYDFENMFAENFTNGLCVSWFYATEKKIGKD